MISDDIEAAAQRIAPHVRRTPLWIAAQRRELGLPGPGFEVWLKLEQLQRSGSFKARGMFNRLLANPIPAAGVIAASGGNAGIATATAAQALGVRSEIFVPTVISPAKRDRLEQLWRRAWWSPARSMPGLRRLPAAPARAVR